MVNIDAFEKGYKARVENKPKKPQGDLTLSENLAWKEGWEAADSEIEDPDKELEENGLTNNDN